MEAENLCFNIITYKICVYKLTRGTKDNRENDILPDSNWIYLVLCLLKEA